MELVEGELAGDPCSNALWIRRSLRKLQKALKSSGLDAGLATIHQLLAQLGISAKSNRKHLAPREHPDRDTQFKYLDELRRRFLALDLPVISVDTKKKELVGLFTNAGQLWCEKAPEVYTHDFPTDASAKAVPYGIYDVGKNVGYVYLGVSADTPEFAVRGIEWWWKGWGRSDYPLAGELLVLADGGGSNGYRPRRWKQQLQVRLADGCGLKVTVCHYPPGASKWNPIEHRLFSQISQTWAGTPLVSLKVMLEGIRWTKTTTGLFVHAELLREVFSKGVKVSNAEMASLVIQKHDTCPLWNYTIVPRKNGK